MKRTITGLSAVALAAATIVGGVSAGDGHDHDHAKETKKAAKAEMNGSLEIGKKAPTFTGTDQRGNTVNLADYEGKVVVIEWTSPACPFVQAHYADGKMTMTTLAEKFGDDVVWLAVDSSNFAKAGDLLKWSEQKGIDYPIVVDAEGAIGRMYGAKTTPHMFVIAPDGTLAYEGAIDDNPRGKADNPTNYVEEAVNAILAGEKVATTSTKSYGCSVKYTKGA
jgi:peroxiredoxin